MYLFLQVVKTNANNHEEYFPTPPKLYVPTLRGRDEARCIKGNMDISERSAHGLRNVERDQWQTTYDRTHTGLGPANPNSLDNMHEKYDKNLRTGVDKDNIVRVDSLQDELVEDIISKNLLIISLFHTEMPQTVEKLPQTDYDLSIFTMPFYCYLGDQKEPERQQQIY